MANAVLTTKVSPTYDDLPELKYHFPKTYLNQVKQALGDLVLYYEPRRESANLSGRAGRQVYFASARLDRIEEDPNRTGYYYGFVSDYLEFPNPVPFRIGASYFESALQKLDGSTNKGAFGRSVRVIPSSEFEMIWRVGFGGQSPTNSVSRIEEEPALYGRSPKTVISERVFRDASFARVIHSNYKGVCAMTGLNLINEKGGYETEAAHIRPVAENGPDSPRNGIALSRTIHWMFDEGMLSVSDSNEILCSERFIPNEIRNILNPGGKILLPKDPSCHPHPGFLRYHRDNVFKGN